MRSQPAEHAHHKAHAPCTAGPALATYRALQSDPSWLRVEGALRAPLRPGPVPSHRARHRTSTSGRAGAPLHGLDPRGRELDPVTVVRRRRVARPAALQSDCSFRDCKLRAWLLPTRRTVTQFTRGARSLPRLVLSTSPPRPLKVCTCIVRVVMLMIVLQTLTMGLNAWPSSGACGGPQGLTLVPPSLGQSPSQNLLGCSQAVSCTTPPATTESGSLLAACVRGDAAWRTSRRMHAQVVDDPAGRRGGRASNCHRRDRVPSDRVLLDARHTL